ncbi:uncharacterized protein DDB_G0280205-like [Acropora millepora]|uniref:uncharacterized protein DDB_G0280205-like n=1 Tax=Acropora millepora TaxID=45264 RepID=UPI001CF16F0F|nr:uncharacterized protein DDB_G0280205-like [Acropora millepora]
MTIDLMVNRGCKVQVAGTSGAQAVPADDLVKQCPSAVSESVGQPDPTTKQQHTEIGAVALTGRGNEGTSRTSGDGLILPELAGPSGAQAIAADEFGEECPSAVSESVGQPDPKTMQQHIEKGAVTSARNNAMTALPNPPQETEQDNSLGRAISHIWRSELRSSSSSVVQNVGVSSIKRTFSGLPETQRKSIDAETVNDAYTTLTDLRREYEDLLQTAASRVGETVFVCFYYYYYFDDDFEDDYDNNINNNNSSNGDDNIDNNSNNNTKWTGFINGGQ